MSKQVPAGWQITSLGLICTINPRLKDKPLGNTEVSFIPMDAVSNAGRLQYRIIKPYSEVSKGFTYLGEGDVLFAKITPCMENGKGAIATEIKNGIGLGSTEFHVLRANEETVNTFIYQYVHWKQFRTYAKANMTGSAGQQRVPTDFLDTYPMLLPPLPEQRKIAAVLSAADRSITATEKLIAKLADLKQALMQQLLTKGIGHTEFKPSPLGLIPKSWVAVELGEICTLNNGRAYKLTEWEKAGTPVIRLQNLTGSGNNYYYSNLKLPDNQYVHPGDLLYMWSASFGPYIWNGPKAIYHYHIWKMSCNQQLQQNYLYHVLGFMTESWKNGTNGSTMLHLTKESMERVNISLPPLPEQRKIAGVLSTVDRKLSAAKVKLAKAKDLKQGLMNDLLTGKVRVSA